MSRRRISTPPVLAGYSPLRPLGSGGFADVFLYEQDLPRRVVAVKVLATDVLDDSLLRAFHAEADVLARLSAHPSIVTVHLASISADGRPFFVMEYCPGSMSARIRQGRLPLADALDTGVRIGAAVETVHRAGLLHRDIKPSNILVTSLGAPVLADFGIAVASRDAGQVAMSVPWSAPEIIQEQSRGSIASEVWSLAATVYTLLAGRSPFEVEDKGRNTREAFAARIGKANYVPTGRSDVPQRLEQALAVAMARNPQHRYPSVRAFAEELRWIQYGLGIPPTNLDVASPEWSREAGALVLDDAQSRGPVISSVNTTPRRAQRANRALEERIPEAEEQAAPPRLRAPRPPWVYAVFGGVVTVALAVVVVILLKAGGAL